MASPSFAIDGGSAAFIVLAGVFGILFALYQFYTVSKIRIGSSDGNKDSVNSDSFKLLNEDGIAGNGRLVEIYESIREGAASFLAAEYKICAIFIVGFGAIVFVLTSSTDQGWKWDHGLLTMISFVVGSTTSIFSGYLGMKVAVYSNARTTVSAASSTDPWMKSFNTAFRAGAVMGFSLCGLALLMLYLLCVLFSFHFDLKNDTDRATLFECIAGYGLGGSSIAMFGRVGGGIYTKAADVGADLAGKVVSGIPEDDPRNPATIADNVGDNVGDVAGMGSDLFGSFAEASCAALVVIAQFATSWETLMFPLMISAVGIFVCAGCSFIATHISPVRKESDVEKVLKVQLATTTLLITAILPAIAYWALDDHFEVTTLGGVSKNGTPIKACVCVWAGLWAGCLIGFITEYYTSHSYKPTREVAQSCETGAATNIIYGLALGYKSAIVPVILLAIVVFTSFMLLDMFGVALAALGMLSNLSTCLTIDVYGPVCDNAGGIAEMAELPEDVRDKTDALDAAGNTTAAIGKGFAIGSACLVGLALFGAFATKSFAKSASPLTEVSLLKPIVFAFLLIGAMIPYWFTAMTMKSVGMAANEMVKEVKRQFDTIPGLLEGTPGHAPPDHAKCIEISTNASLREMILPGILVIFTPILTGVIFGTSAVAGLLSGAISSAIQMAISSSNTGGAWDNAKKYVEKGCVLVDGVVQKKGSEVHKAAVCGDTVGDPLKDTSGPALNIVMKLMAILSLVFSGLFLSIQDGKGLIGYAGWD